MAASTVILSVIGLFILSSAWPAHAASIFSQDVSAGNKSHPIKIAAFNIKIFGATKAEKPDVMNDLAKIVKEFDITLIQEIRETTDKAIMGLMKLLNSKYGGVWAFKQSIRLGRSSSKEQYAYIYNKTSVTILKTYQYGDSHDYFERQPYGVLVEYRKNKFGLLGVHIKPDDAEKEIGYLTRVYNDAKRSKYFNTENMLIMGDFNAGCSYVANKDWKDIDLWTDRRFTWLISNDQDTTVAGSDCPYDRIVMAGDRMKALVDGQGQVYRFDSILGLSQEEADARSDHFPVYVTLSDDGLGSATNLVFNPFVLLMTSTLVVMITSRT